MDQHAVQFYREVPHLVRAASAFVTEAHSAGEGALLIASRSSLDAISRRVGSRPGLATLDAHEALALIVEAGRPDPERFRATIQPLLQAAARHGKGRVRVYSELAAILQADGQSAAALELEHLWGRLGERPRLRLLCGYALAAFPAQGDAGVLASVLDAHGEAYPAEGPPGPTEDAIRRHLIGLQHRVHHLERVVAQSRATEQELSKRVLELDDIVVNAFEGMHRVGPDGTILWVNPAELQMLGYTASEYIGHDIRDFHEDVAVVDRIMARLKAGQRVDQEPARMRAKDGSIRHVLIRSGGHMENGVFVHSHCFTRDVTDLVVGGPGQRGQRLVSLAAPPSESGMRASREALATIATAVALLRADPAQAWRQHWINTIQEQVRVMMHALDGKRTVESRIPPPAP